MSIKIQAAARLKAYMNDWVQAMNDIVSMVSSKIARDLSFDTGDGVVIKKKEAFVLIRAFKTRGYRVKEVPAHGLSLVQSTEAETRGLRIDFRADLDDPDQCLIRYYDEAFR